MTGPYQYALTVGPLGVYLWLLALWQSSRHPRVVRGLTDFACLAFGVGGFLAFGPFGRFVTQVWFGRPAADDWVVFLSLLGLGAVLLARKALHRLVIYHVEPADVFPALEDALGQVGGRFVRTLDGFEDRLIPRGVRVDVTRWLRCAVVEAHGHDPEGLIQQVRPRLRQHFRAVPSPPSRVALGLYGGSILVTVAPIVSAVLTQPEAWAALRAWLERLRGV